MVKNDGRGPARWGQFRHAVIGRLLAAPPAHGELHATLELMAQEEWEHPVTGEPVRFAVSTLERWYYAALHAARDPVGALGKTKRADAGRHRRVDGRLAQVIAAQYENHKSWTCRLHWDNLRALAREMRELVVPSYTTLRRYMRGHGLLRQPRAQDGERPRAGKGHKEVRSYEREYVNSLWHTDFHECSRALCGPDGTWQKPQLVALMDDCSRLSCHGQFYWDETAETLVHGTKQAFQKRKLPGELMSDGGAAMKAAEFREGLANLGVRHCMTLPYSPYQNGKQESFWNRVEDRFLPMLEGCRDLTLEQLNNAFQAWVELDYNRGWHSELGTSPLARYLEGHDVGRPCPDSDDLRRAFRMGIKRQQRQSDGTISVESRRFEIPSRYRHEKDIHIRYARWDLRTLTMVDPRTGAELCRLFPLDKHRNADGRRRTLAASPAEHRPPGTPPPSGMAPLLRQQVSEYYAGGLPPPYLPRHTSSMRDLDELTPDHPSHLESE
jgi:putative transposase